MASRMPGSSGPNTPIFSKSSSSPASSTTRTELAQRVLPHEVGEEDVVVAGVEHRARQRGLDDQRRVVVAGQAGDRVAEPAERHGGEDLLVLGQLEAHALHVGEDVGDVGAEAALDQLDLPPVDAAVGVPVVDDRLRRSSVMSPKSVARPASTSAAWSMVGQPILIVSSVTPVLSPAAAAVVEPPPSDPPPAESALVQAPEQHQRGGAQRRRHLRRVPSSAHAFPLARRLRRRRRRRHRTPDHLIVSMQVRAGIARPADERSRARSGRVRPDRRRPRGRDATRAASDRPGRGRSSRGLESHGQLRPQRRRRPADLGRDPRPRARRRRRARLHAPRRRPPAPHRRERPHPAGPPAVAAQPRLHPRASPPSPSGWASSATPRSSTRPPRRWPASSTPSPACSRSPSSPAPSTSPRRSSTGCGPPAPGRCSASATARSASSRPWCSTRPRSPGWPWTTSPSRGHRSVRRRHARRSRVPVVPGRPPGGRRGRPPTSTAWR